MEDITKSQQILRHVTKYEVEMLNLQENLIF